MENNAKVAFGGGCFWCTEAVFKMLKGVTKVLPGYAGGAVANPTYEQVCGGQTGHAEVAYIEYDPAQVKYRDLLTVFFASHDPTTANRQGNDVGTQYRSIVLCATPAQEKETRDFIAELNASNAMGKALVTEVKPLGVFYPADASHQDYYARNKEAGYCQVIINPKLEKVQEKFADLLKENAII
jgi:peptide-methionine (S)-S-oxide reductase